MLLNSWTRIDFKQILKLIFERKKSPFLAYMSFLSIYYYSMACFCTVLYLTKHYAIFILLFISITESTSKKSTLTKQLWGNHAYYCWDYEFLYNVYDSFLHWNIFNYYYYNNIEKMQNTHIKSATSARKHAR